MNEAMTAKFVFGELTFKDVMDYLNGKHDSIYCIPPRKTWNEWIQVKIKSNSEGYWIHQVYSGLGKHTVINQRVQGETPVCIKGHELNWTDDQGENWRLRFTVNATVQLGSIFMEEAK